MNLQREIANKCTRLHSAPRRLGCQDSDDESIAVMAAKKRRHRPAAVDAEEGLLSKGRWSQYRANEALHRPDENHHARRRCRQLIEGGGGGVDAISWDELTGQR